MTELIFPFIACQLAACLPESRIETKTISSLKMEDSHDCWYLPLGIDKNLVEENI
jgi:hypothetical protein